MSEASDRPANEGRWHDPHPLPGGPEGVDHLVERHGAVREDLPRDPTLLVPLHTRSHERTAERMAVMPLPLPVARAGEPELTVFGFYSRAEHALEHALGDLAMLKLVDEGAARILADSYADRLFDTLDPRYDPSEGA